MTGNILAGADFLDAAGIVRQRNRRQTLAVKKTAPAPKVKTPPGNAGRLPFLRQIGYLLRDDVQEKPGRGIRHRAGFPQVKQPIAQIVQVKVIPGHRFRGGQGGIIGSQRFRIHGEGIQGAVPAAGLAGMDSLDGIVRQGNYRQTIAAGPPAKAFQSEIPGCKSPFPGAGRQIPELRRVGTQLDGGLIFLLRTVRFGVKQPRPALGSRLQENGKGFRPGRLGIFLNCHGDALPQPGRRQTVQFLPFGRYPIVLPDNQVALGVVGQGDDRQAKVAQPHSGTFPGNRGGAYDGPMPQERCLARHDNFHIDLPRPVIPLAVFPDKGQGAVLQINIVSSPDNGFPGHGLPVKLPVGRDSRGRHSGSGQRFHGD